MVNVFLAPLDISELHGFGRSTRQKAQDKLGTTKIGELANKSKGALCDALGKATGETLYNAIRGIDGKKLESDQRRKSVSCEINVGGLVVILITRTVLIFLPSMGYVLEMPRKWRSSCTRWPRS